MTTISINEKELHLNGSDWSGDEKLVARARLAARLLPVSYYPDPETGLAMDVAEVLGGRVISAIPEPPEFDETVVY